MKLINPFIFLTYVRSAVKKKDLEKSKYFFLYEKHLKMGYKEYVESITIEKANDIINQLYPKRIPKKLKYEILDCLIIFLRKIHSSYQHYPGDKRFNADFNKIVRTYLEKLKFP